MYYRLFFIGKINSIQEMFIVTWQPGWEGNLGKNGYMVVSLLCPSETITTLLIGYTPIQNKKIKKIKIKRYALSRNIILALSQLHEQEQAMKTW